ncbi:hypothetical protein ILUMI_22585 [Ignelater luminosus]|uniref:Glucuronosyltransferase n=1 Tax=Ignelater luminosus TaxID=2038154 RepID=A0A8K0FXC6_IGNLU|nr:hypothetical protein ILUMI_22585 [Ignelater luminosus]
MHIFTMRFEIFSLGFLLIMINGGISYRFLGLFPLPIKSHFFVVEKLMKVLTEKGHEVDVLSPFPQEKPIPRYNDISVASTLPYLENHVSLEDMISLTAWEAAAFMFKAYGTEVCENILKHPQTEKLKNTKVKYDAIITEVFGTDCLLGFVHLFDVPVIGVTSTMQLPWGDERVGNPDNPAYIPNYFVPRKGKMILFHKIEIALAAVLSKFGYHLLSTIPSEMRARDFFGTNMPPLDYIAANTSLLLVNTNFLINDPRPTVPGLIEVGGIHIEKTKPLPQNLTKAIQSSKEGIIYFSMGTVIRMDTFPKEALNSILGVFSKLPHTVFWKGSAKSLPKPIPKNIVAADWFPQLDILCDPRTRLFVTHGGQLSIQEAIHCGVPILGIPVLAVQRLNVMNYEMYGAGKLLEYQDIQSEDLLNEIIEDVLYNSSYRIKAKQLSKIYRDRPMNPSDTAAYWVEYVVRHDGARHLRTRGADLIWFEYYLVDVVLVFIVLFIVFAIMFLYFLNLVQTYFDSPPIPHSKEKQK